METNRFKKALEAKEFVYTLELVPGRGARGKVFEDTTRMAEKAIQGGKMNEWKWKKLFSIMGESVRYFFPISPILKVRTR